MKKGFLIAALLVGLFGATDAQATTYTVCASGCDYTGATWQAALDAAVAGDVFKLKAGETYTGHWDLANLNIASDVIIRSDTADSNLPAAGVRIDPSFAAFMPTLQSDSTSEPVFNADKGADHFTLLGLRFLNNPGGYGEILRLGSNECTSTRCNEFEADETDHITVDRCLFSIDPIVGQKRGVELGGKNLSVINSYMPGFAGLGQDAQAVHGANGRGPVLIENNYLEATTEDILFGGDDPAESTVMTVTGTPTTSSASVSVSAGKFGATHNLSELHVGDHLAIVTQSGTVRRHTTLRSVTGTGTTGSITFDPIPEVPDKPGDIRMNITVKGVTIRRNHITKQLRWLNPIVDTPTLVNAAATTGTGSLAAGTYQYTIVPYNDGGYQGATVWGKTQTVTATLGATGEVTVTWADAANATNYRIYGRTSAGITMRWDVDQGTETFTDDGTAGTAASATPKASYWQLKNLLELKAAQSVLISGNVLEYQWGGSDIGYAIWIKTANQNSTAEGIWTRDVVMENNLIRHVDGVLEMVAAEYYTGTADDAPAPVTNFTFRNNLIYDSGQAWALFKGGTGTAGYAMSLSSGSVNTTIDHNTFIHTARGVIQFNGSAHAGLTVTNNFAIRNSYGILGSGSQEGTASLTKFATAYTVTANAIAGISTGSYPAGNFGPSTATFQAQFANYSADGSDTANGAADFHLASDSLYLTSATDGTAIGADIDAILTATDGVTSGSSAPTDPPPAISTTSLPHGTDGTDYSVTLQGSGVGSLTWEVSTGTLPDGLSLSTAGVLSGTPTTPGTSTFTVEVTDGDTSLTADQELTLVIDQTFVNVSITTTALTDGVIGQGYSATLAKADGLAPFTWSVSVGSLPPGLALDASTGIISGIPTGDDDASYTFTVQVVGSLGTSASKSLTISVGKETMPAGRHRSFNNLFESATFLRTSCPTTGVRKGDLCSDTSGVDAVLKIATQVTPSIVWAKVSSAATSHALLSETHSDTVADSPQDGDTIIANDGRWSRLALGPAGSVLTSDGSGVGWSTPASGGSTSTERGTTVTLMTRTSASIQWANVPSTKQEFNASTGNRALINLTGYTTARLYARVFTAGSTGTNMWIEYSTDETTWTALDGNTGPTVDIGSSGGKTSAPIVIAPGARQLVYLRIVASGGDGVTDPTFGNILVELE